MKEKCSLLINSITPESLKEEIKNALHYQSPEAKTNECKPHDLILAKALEQDREFRQSKRKRTSEDVPLWNLYDMTNIKTKAMHENLTLV
ncbi:hypothetical protein PC115_g17172 [Phytophthora cactorum]|uniref:Uncharacterized protein n=1 Tax=Phytophthora cactorum TaxID=29920 RepID=A0A8T1B8F2_9STRA|nr:hypothetical protein PC115_g17172 [Phytophthora cactorum]